MKSLIKRLCFDYFMPVTILLGLVACTTITVPENTPSPTPPPLATLPPTPSPTPVYPANITVTTTDDENNRDGDCSLREAILAANEDMAVDACAAGQGEDYISLPPGTYTFSLEEGRKDASASGDLDILTALNIRGAGTQQVILDAAHLDRIFHVLPEGALTLSQLSLRNGETSGGGDSGGGIFNEGTLTVTDCILSDNLAGGRGGALYNVGQASLTRCTITRNRAKAGGGGGISNHSTLNLTDCAISHNQSDKNGGGIMNNRGTLNMSGGEISHNNADINGGGIRSRNNGEITLDNVLVRYNSAGQNGGGISNFGPLVGTQSDFDGNQAQGNGGAIGNGAAITLTATILSNNSAGRAGGGVYNSGDATLHMQGGALVGNHVGSSDAPGADCSGPGFVLENVQTTSERECDL